MQRWQLVKLTVRGGKKHWSKGSNLERSYCVKVSCFKPLVPTKINGISWENIPTEKLATDLSLWQLDPKDTWHGFNKVALGEAIISPLKLTITSPGVDLKTGKYTETGIVSPLVGEFLIEKGSSQAKLISIQHFFLDPW